MLNPNQQKITWDSLRGVTADVLTQQNGDLKKYERFFDGENKFPKRTFASVFEGVMADKEIVDDQTTISESSIGIDFSIGQGGGMNQQGEAYQEDGILFGQLEYVTVKDQKHAVQMAQILQKVSETMRDEVSQEVNGSCVAEMLVLRDLKGNVYIITGNMGDCRVVLKRGDAFIRLTKTHHPEMFDEAQYLQENNYKTERGRIGPYGLGLRVTRSYGDAFFKGAEGGFGGFGSRGDGEYGVYFLSAEMAKNAEVIITSDGLESLHEKRMKELYADPTFQSKPNKALALKNIAHSISAKIRTPDNASVAVFELDKIQSSFCALGFDDHGGQGSIKNILAKLFTENLSREIKLLAKNGILHHKAEASFFPLLPDAYQNEGIKDKFDRFCGKLTAPLPEDISFPYKGDFEKHLFKESEQLAERRRADLMPAPDDANKRIHSPQMITFVLDTVSSCSFVTAFDLWIPILQWAKTQNIKFRFQEAPDNKLEPRLIKRLRQDLRNCFGVNCDQFLSVFNPELPTPPSDIYIIPAKCAPKKSGLNIIRVPEQSAVDNPSVTYITTFATILGMEDVLSRIINNHLDDEKQKDILKRYNLAKSMRCSPERSNEQAMKEVLPLISHHENAEYSSDSDEDYDGNTSYLMLNKVSEMETQQYEEFPVELVKDLSNEFIDPPVEPIKENLKEEKMTAEQSYQEIIKMTVIALRRYCPQIVKKEPEDIILDVGGVAEIQQPLIRPVIHLDPEVVQEARRFCGVSRIQALWLIIAMTCFTGGTSATSYFGAEVIEENIKQLITRNPQLISLLLTIVEIFGGLLAEAPLIAVTGFISGVKFCFDFLKPHTIQNPEAPTNERTPLISGPNN